MNNHYSKMTSFAFLIMCFFLPSNLYAQISLSEIFNGVELGQSPEQVENNIREVCKSHKWIVVPKPSFPLASASEKHLICEQIDLYGGFTNFDKVAFTFADGALVQVQAFGEAIKLVVNNLFYEKYRVFSGPEIKVVDEEKKMLWFVTHEGQHTNLFAWDNPYLRQEQLEVDPYETSATVPEIFQMGSSFDEIKDNLISGTTYIHVQRFGTVVQANCFGVEYAGFPRKMEARFENDRLDVVWILTAKQEEDRIRQALRDTYGEIIFSNEEWDVFNDWQTMLRKQVKPEVLILSKAKSKEYKQKISGK